MLIPVVEYGFLPKLIPAILDRYNSYRAALAIILSEFRPIHKNKKENLAKARASLKINPPITKIPNDWQQISLHRLGFDPQICTYCGAKAMVRIDILPPTRAPPNQIPQLKLTTIS